ncbi:MAG: PilZ domain-containing protein [Gemmataceae bacterium]|nr:PilZ domain-containing protein [Gemmataceae bacterium]
MPTAEERRRAQRFPLELPVKVKWGREGEEVQEPGTVRDISANGIYFLLSHDLQPESKVEFYVRLRVEGAPEGGVLLHCVGSVVRVENRDPERIGVAARIDRYRFLRPGELPEADMPVVEEA